MFPRKTLLSLFFAVVAINLVCADPVFAEGHQVLLQGKGRLAVLDHANTVVWEMPWRGVHDMQLLENGNFLVLQGRSGVAEIDPKTKKVVWAYDSATQNGNGDKQVEVHAAQRLPNGLTMIAESGVGRIIEVDRDGHLIQQVSIPLDNPNPHSDTRLVRKLPNGDYLIANEADGKVRQLNSKGDVVWEYTVPMFGKEPKNGHGPESFGNRCFAALRLENGNTLIATGNGHSVLEVTPGQEIVWQVHQNDLPGIRLGWVTTLQLLANGNLLIGNCHAGPGQPVLIELNRQTKEVVWTLDAHNDFGNDVSNTVVASRFSL